MPISERLLCTSDSRQRNKWAIWRSAYPFCFASNINSFGIFPKWYFSILRSNLIKSSIWRRNQISIFVFSWIVLNGIPNLIASYTWNKRFQLGFSNEWRIASWFVNSRPSAPNPLRLISKDWQAFCKASWKLRPIPITSPTDFICNPTRRSVPGNLLKFQRGILTIT